MKVVVCEKEHYYDADKYDACPHCGSEIIRVLEMKFIIHELHDQNGYYEYLKNEIDAEDRKNRKLCMDIGIRPDIETVEFWTSDGLLWDYCYEDSFFLDEAFSRAECEGTLPHLFNERKRIIASLEEKLKRYREINMRCLQKGMRDGVYQIFE